MTWLLGQMWVFAVVAFLLGFLITWPMLVRTRRQARPTGSQVEDLRARDTAGGGRHRARPASPDEDAEAGATVAASEGASEAAHAGASPAGAEPAEEVAATGSSTAAATPAATQQQSETPSEAPRRTRAPILAGWAAPEPVEPVAQPEPEREEPAVDVLPSRRYRRGVLPMPDGSAPSGYPIKATADSLVFHTPDSPRYERARAEVCFADEETAQEAGFRRWHTRDS